MEDAIIIARLLNDPAEKPSPLWVNDMLRRYPAFMLPALLLLKRNPDDMDPQGLQRLQTLVAVNCADRTALIDYIDPSGEGWASMYPPKPETTMSTEQAIDDFISTYGKPSSQQEDAVLERLIMNPVPADYFADTDQPYDPDDPLALPPELMKHDPQEHDEHQDTTPVAASPAAETVSAPKKPEKAAIHAEDSLLMESLAKIFIKQQRYERAYEIISKLSLNYPEKSVYFADQLRFLQKLMINQRHKSR